MQFPKASKLLLILAPSKFPLAINIIIYNLLYYLRIFAASEASCVY